MSQPTVMIHFNDHNNCYQPGEVLTGYYRFDNLRADDVLSLEMSVLWYTEGKGDKDIGVHQFKRFSVAEGDYIDPRHPGRFSTQLPNSPLSYHGSIFSIHWCARVRVFLVGGQEIAQDHAFLLGKVHAARELKSNVQLQPTGAY